MGLKTFNLSTNRRGIYDITSNVCETINESHIKDGLVVIQCRYETTTAGFALIKIDFQHDLLLALSEFYPNQQEMYCTWEKRTESPKRIRVNPYQIVHIKNGKPVLDTEQGVYFCEFEAPEEGYVRHRPYCILW